MGILLIVQIPRGLFIRTELKAWNLFYFFTAALKRGSLSIGIFGPCVPLRVEDALKRCFACFQGRQGTVRYNWLPRIMTSVHSLSELQLAGIKPDYSQEDDTVNTKVATDQENNGSKQTGGKNGLPYYGGEGI